MNLTQKHLSVRSVVTKPSEDFNLSGGCMFLIKLLLVIPCSQVAQMYSWTIIMFTILAHLMLQCIESLDKGCNNILPRDPNGLETYLNSYAALRIIILIAEIEIGTIISTFMGIGMMLCIVFNYGSINLQTILPMSIYVYCPVLAIIVPGAIKVMLPMIVDIYENGKLFVESWKYLLAKTEKKKYLVRRVRCTNILCLYAEMFGFRIYMLQKSTKATYYYAIFDFTCTALLSIDSNWFV